MRKIKILSTNEVGYFHQFDMQNCAAIELENGTVKTLWTGDIQFLDSPEAEQRAEFAKAAMQGLLSNRLRENVEGWELEDYIKESVKAADILISELKKQKP